MTILSQQGLPSQLQTVLGAAFQTVNMVALHPGAAGASTTFALQGTAASPAAAYTAGFNQPFPGPKAGSLRARAWTNSLAQPLTITLMKNGTPALDAAGNPVAIVIPAGVTTPVLDSANIVTYEATDTFDVRLTSTGGGGGNSALVGIAIEALD